eukprot:TRINITY_DN8952_c0_g2_i1.p1 TRINITY_DN8952_c0_g2~~TRINITY_DN8952_c0_g2_i1.p1  ORF type:complete len:219 (+),score=29.16 TRINITY_DN8952_c0_g2_i1:82-738(+)
MMSDENLVRMAVIAFADEEAWFQGRIIRQQDQLGLLGVQCEAPSGGCTADFHHCCFDHQNDPPFFFKVTLYDYANNTEAALPDVVAKTNGDNAKLDSRLLKFDTDRVLVGENANEYIAKFFPKLQKHCDPIVCVGEIELDPSSIFGTRPPAASAASAKPNGASQSCCQAKSKRVSWDEDEDGLNAKAAKLQPKSNEDDWKELDSSTHDAYLSRSNKNM